MKNIQESNVVALPGIAHSVRETPSLFERLLHGEVIASVIKGPSVKEIMKAQLTDAPSFFTITLSQDALMEPAKVLAWKKNEVFLAAGCYPNFLEVLEIIVRFQGKDAYVLGELMEGRLPWGLAWPVSRILPKRSAWVENGLPFQFGPLKAGEDYDPTRPGVICDFLFQKRPFPGNEYSAS